MHKNSQRAPVLNFNSVSRRNYKSTHREASLKIRYFDFNKFIPNFTPTRAITYTNIRCSVNIMGSMVMKVVYS